MADFSDIFSRNLGALTAEQLQILQQSRVAVVGCGGLGGFVIELLARVGVGELLLFDPDIFTPSNCNRQLNALSSSLGKNKAQVAAERVAAIHDFCRAGAFPADFRALLAGGDLAPDAVVDCLDNSGARRDLARWCLQQGKALVHGAVHGWYGQVGVQLPGHDLIGILYPEEALAAEPQTAPTVLSFTVATVAAIQAGEVVKHLLGLPSPLHNTWMHLDLHRCDFTLFA